MKNKSLTEAEGGNSSASPTSNSGRNKVPVRKSAFASNSGSPKNSPHSRPKGGSRTPSTFNKAAA